MKVLRNMFSGKTSIDKALYNKASLKQTYDDHIINYFYNLLEGKKRVLDGTERGKVVILSYTPGFRTFLVMLLRE